MHLINLINIIRWPHTIEHLVIASTSGQIVWSIAYTHPLNNCYMT